MQVPIIFSLLPPNQKMSLSFYFHVLCLYVCEFLFCLLQLDMDPQKMSKLSSCSLKKEQILTSKTNLEKHHSTQPVNISSSSYFNSDTYLIQSPFFHVHDNVSFELFSFIFMFCGCMWFSFLSFAANEGHTAVVELLLAKGANVNIQDNDRRDTPIFFAGKYVIVK